MTIESSFGLIATAVKGKNRLLGSLLQSAAGSTLTPQMIAAVDAVRRDPLSQDSAVRSAVQEFLQTLPAVNFQAEDLTVSLSVISLAAHCPLFLRKITGIWKEHTDTTIKLDGICKEALVVFKQFVETGKVDTDLLLQHFEDLLQIAYEWQELELIQALTWALYSKRPDLDAMICIKISKIGGLYHNVPLMAIANTHVQYYPHHLEIKIQNPTDLKIYKGLKEEPPGLFSPPWRMEIHRWTDDLLDVCRGTLCPQEVALYCTNLTDKVLIKLFNALRTGTGLQKLSLEAFSFSEKTSKALFDCLQGVSSLRALDLSKSSFSRSDGFAGITRALQVLTLEDAGLREADLEVLHPDCSLAVLNLAGNKLPILGAQFMQFLSATKTLSELNLKGCGLSPESFNALCMALKEGKTVARLILSENTITDAAPLVQLLEQNAHLQELVLDSCGLSSEHVCMLCRALVNNQELVSLDLGGNALDAPACAAIAALVHQNGVLKVLGLSNCGLSNELVQPIITAVQSRPLALELNLFLNPL